MTYKNEDEKALYNIVRNILHNEMSVHRAGIEQMIREEVENQAKHIINSINLESIILNQLAITQKNSKSRVMFGYRESAFGDLVQEAVAKEISSRLKDRLEKMEIKI